MKSIDVEGATGNVHTNYTGKANAAIEAFRDGYEYVYIHVEAPDECGHRAELENKVKSIEAEIDSYFEKEKRND
jgi:2,3-bisphosphoglycerate-independent phosphoglycerate mutase